MTKSKSAYELMQELSRKVAFAIVDGGLFVFNGNFYEVLTDEKARALIVHHCRESVAEEGVPTIVKNILEFLRMEPRLRVQSREDPNILAFRNGIMHLESQNFEPCSPEYFVTSIIDCEYNPTEPIWCPVFDKFLYYISGGSPIILDRMWEILGYLLSPDMSGKCFILLQGESNTGKSVLGAFVASIFNEEASAHIDLFRMGDRFSLSGIVGKRVNTSLDLPSGMLNERAVSIIKMLTGGDKITVEVKYQNPFSYLSSCKLLFATNNAVGLRREDPVFWKRIRLLPFINSVPDKQQDKNLLSKFKSEKNSIVKKALSAFLRLRSNNFVFSGGNDLGISNFGRINSTEQQTDKFIVRKFVDVCCQIVPQEQGGCFTSILHKRYQQYCNMNGYPPINDSGTFSELLRSIYGDSISPSKWRDKTVSDGSLRGYLGIILSD